MIELPGCFKTKQRGPAALPIRATWTRHTKQNRPQKVICVAASTAFDFMVLC